jgi:SAM-dependent methyltransferase
MPDGAARPDRNLTETGIPTLRMAAQRVAESFHSGSCPADRAFDRLLPDELRGVSGQYWTPLAVARRAAGWFDDLGIRTVVDIGSGAGKFCVAAALAGHCRFTGLELRPSLVASARALTRLFELHHRVSFVEGAFGVVATPSADAYYLYNPFGRYLLGPAHGVDASVELSDTRCARDIAAVEELLRRAPGGTYVLTYNGFGGRVPDGYQQIRVDRKLPNELRLWRKPRRIQKSRASSG